MERGFVVMAFLSFAARPVVGLVYSGWLVDVVPHPILSKWYVIAKPCCVSVPLIEVHDLGGAVWSQRRCIGPAFGEV